MNEEKIRNVVRETLTEFGFKIKKNSKYYIVKCEFLDDQTKIGRAIKDYDKFAEVYRYRCEMRTDEKPQYALLGNEFITEDIEALANFLLATNFACVVSKRPEKNLTFIYAAKSFGSVPTKAAYKKRNEVLAKIMGIMVDGTKEKKVPRQLCIPFIDILTKTWTQETNTPIYHKNAKILDEWMTKNGDNYTPIKSFRDKYKNPISNGLHFECWHIDLPKPESITFNTIRRVPGQWLEADDISRLAISLYNARTGTKFNTLINAPIVEEALNKLGEKYGIKCRTHSLSHRKEYCYTYEAYKNAESKRNENYVKQQNVLNCFKEYKDIWFSITELARMTGKPKKDVIAELKQLIQKGNIAISDNNLYQYIGKNKDAVDCQAIDTVKQILSSNGSNVKFVKLDKDELEIYSAICRIGNDKSTYNAIQKHIKKPFKYEIFKGLEKKGVIVKKIAGNGEPLYCIASWIKGFNHNTKEVEFQPDYRKQLYRKREDFCKFVIENGIAECEECGSKLKTNQTDPSKIHQKCRKKKLVKPFDSHTSEEIKVGDWVLMFYQSHFYPAIVIPICAADDNICKLRKCSHNKSERSKVCLYFERNLALTKDFRQVKEIHMGISFTKDKPFWNREDVIKISPVCSKEVWKIFKNLENTKPIVRKPGEILRGDDVQLIKSFDYDELKDINPSIPDRVKNVEVGEIFEALFVGPNHPKAYPSRRKDVIWIKPSKNLEAVAIPSHYFVPIKDDMREAILEIEGSGTDRSWNEKFIQGISDKIVQVFEEYPNVWLSLEEITDLVGDRNCSTIAARAAIEIYLEDDYSTGIIRKPNTRYFMFNPLYRDMSETEYEIFRHLQKNPNKNIHYNEIKDIVSTVDIKKIIKSLDNIVNNPALYVTASKWAADNDGFYCFNEDDYNSHKEYMPVKDTLTVDPIQKLIIGFLETVDNGRASNKEIIDYVLDADDKNWFKEKVCVEDIDVALQDLVEKNVLSITIHNLKDTKVFIFNLTMQFGGWAEVAAHPTSQPSKIYINCLENHRGKEIYISDFQYHMIYYMYLLWKGRKKIHLNRRKCYDGLEGSVGSIDRVHAKDICMYLEDNRHVVDMNKVTTALGYLRDQGIIIDNYAGLPDRAPENPPDPGKDIDEAKYEIAEWNKAKKEKSKPRWSLSPSFLRIYDGIKFDKVIGYYNSKTNEWSYEGKSKLQKKNVLIQPKGQHD